MYQSILIPLDGSAFSEHALPMATALARRAHAALHLVHVHVPIVSTYVEGLPIDDLDPKADAEARQREQAYLERLHRRLAANGDVSVTAILLEAPVVPALHAYIQAQAIDVMVMTTHGRGGFARFWLGSTADTLVRDTAVPVLLQRPDERLPQTVQPTTFKHILIPLDGSAAAEAVLERVVAFGTLMDSTYSLLRVVEPSLVLGYDAISYGGGLAVEAEGQQEQASTAYLAQVAEQLHQLGVHTPIQTRVVSAPQAARAILQDAQAYGIDAIALTTHARHGPSRLLLGSTADKVIRGTHLPVLIYHPSPTDNLLEARQQNVEVTAPA